MQKWEGPQFSSTSNFATPLQLVFRFPISFRKKKGGGIPFFLPIQKIFPLAIPQNNQTTPTTLTATVSSVAGPVLREQAP